MIAGYRAGGSDARSGWKAGAFPPRVTSAIGTASAHRLSSAVRLGRVLDGQFARRCRAGRRHRRRRCRRAAAERRTRRCSSSATPTPTIYIFGTFHALDGHPHWFSEQVRDAFEQSNELVLETLVPEGPSAADQLSASRFSAPSVTPSASFLATTRMAINAGRSQGMQVGNGADMVLRHVGRSRRQAGRGPRNARIAAQHVQPNAGRAAAARPRRERRPSGRRQLDGEPVEGDGRDAVGVEARRPERLRADARPARSAPRRTPIG